MRRIKVLIYDDDPFVKDLFFDLLSADTYEMQFFDSAVVCPVYESIVDTCDDVPACADVIMADYALPRMTGTELLRRQAERGCRIAAKNKAIMSGYLPSYFAEDLVRLGCSFLQKPLSFPKLFVWLNECSTRIDFSRPVAIQRRAERYPIDMDIRFSLDVWGPLFDASLVNISSYGLCLRSAIPLVEDQRIRIETRLPNACRDASVRWIRPEQAGTCVAGLSCC